MQLLYLIQVVSFIFFFNTVHDLINVYATTRVFILYIFSYSLYFYIHTIKLNISVEIPMNSLQDLSAEKYVGISK